MGPGKGFLELSDRPGTPEGDVKRKYRLTENQIWEAGAMSLVWVLIELKMPIKHPKSNVHGSGVQEKG